MKLFTSSTTYSFLCLLMMTLVVITISGCGVGTGEATNSDLANDLGFAGAPAYVVVNLDTKAIEPRIDIPDLTTNAQWKSSFLVFHRVPAQTNVKVGLSEQQYKAAIKDYFLANIDSDEIPDNRPAFSHADLYVSVFELTRSQWLKLGGTDTWSEYGPILTGDSSTRDLPACGMSRDEVVLKLRKSGVTNLRLPTRNEWEVSCRGTALGLYAWGDDQSKYAPYAAVWPLSGPSGDTNTAEPAKINLLQVGKLQPNTDQLYDMHGNIAELVAPDISDAPNTARVCGGSWNDTVLTARATNVVSIPSNQGHPLVGLRLVVTP